MEFNLKRGDLANCVSLDRLIPSVGYVRENVVVICYRCNSIKTDAALLELETVAAGLRRELEKRLLKRQTSDGESTIPDDKGDVKIPTCDNDTIART